MSALYLETSAALTWLFGQNRAEDVRAAVDEASLVSTSALTFTEIERAMIRAESEKLLLGADAQRMRGVLFRARTGWMAMSVSEEVLERSGRPFPVEPIRTLDAIHLATALTFTRAFPDLRILTFDRRIAANAQALGLL